MPKEKKFNQDEVLDKAMFLFWQKGYYNTSIQDLVAHLGISRSSLYDTFGGKKKLFLKSIERYKAGGDIRAKQALTNQVNIKESIKHLFFRLVQMDHQDPNCKGCFIANTTTELLPTDPQLLEFIASHRNDQQQLFYTVLQKGVEDGQIKEGKDLKALSSLLYTLMTGLRVIGKTKPDLNEINSSVNLALSVLD